MLLVIGYKDIREYIYFDKVIKLLDFVGMMVDLEVRKFYLYLV